MFHFNILKEKKDFSVQNDFVFSFKKTWKLDISFWVEQNILLFFFVCLVCLDCKVFGKEIGFS